jgi:tetratricopeptide (TPR) repeat protein
MVDAYYTAGVIYKDGLEAYTKAQEMFDAVNNRFPRHKLMLESLYNLYLIALKLKQNDAAEKYKQKIIADYPESVIAKILKDPAYINEAKNKEKALDDYFQSAYNDYATGKYDSAWIKCEMSDVVFKPNPYSARFQLLEALILSKENRLGDYVQALNGIINKTTDAPVKKTATDLLSLLNKSKLQQIDLSKDTAMRDSLNAKYQIQRPVSVNASKPDSAELTELQKLEAARQLAIKQGKFVDTTAKGTAKDTTGKAAAKDSTGKVIAVAADTETQEDTTGPYKRSDALTHYFIIYIKDPAAQQSAIMNIMAKVNAFNSLQFAAKKLQAKQVIIDKTNRLLNIRQFNNHDDAMAYYRTIITQKQLFSDLTPDQITITVISTLNFSTLLSNKDIDNYQTFFNRVYR